MGEYVYLSICDACTHLELYGGWRSVDCVDSNLQGLMSYDPNKRLTAWQALAHPWLGAFAIAPTSPAPTSRSSPQVPPALPPAGPSAANYSTPIAQRRHNPTDASSSSSSSSSTSTPSSTSVQGKGSRSNSNDVLDMVLHPHHNAGIQGIFRFPDMLHNLRSYTTAHATAHDQLQYVYCTSLSRSTVSKQQFCQCQATRCSIGGYFHQRSSLSASV